VAVREIPILDAPAVVAETRVRRGPLPFGRLLVGVGACVAGVAIVVIAGWVMRSSGGGTRGLVALAGGVLLWQGGQRLGVLRFGTDFRLGLWVSLGWIALVVICAVFAGLLPIEDWETADQSREAIRMRPGLRWPEPLGRTEKGYSELSHLIYGARTSLMIGALAVIVGLAIGAVIGLLAGWYGKAVDASVTVVTNVILAFPPLILLLSVVAIYGRSRLTISLALALVSIPTYTRLMRAQTMAVRQREYVLASRALGAKDGRVMLREILPNAILPVASYSFLVIAVVIVAEASLSYLGVGVPPPTPSWGGMIVRGQAKLKSDPHLVFVPATVMFLTVLSLNRVGDHVRRNVFNKSDGR
jgi:peptide/nickel transport system permease protein